MEEARSVAISMAIDSFADGAQPYEAVVHVTGSADVDYAALADVHVGITNIDDEMAHLLALQNAYSANARVMSSIKQMYDTLIQAM